jgi:ribosome biogenesis GTPase
LAALAGDLPPGLIVGRVTRVDRGRATVRTAAGSARPHTTEPVAVGDWVALDPTADRVAVALPRRSAISRRDPDGTSEALVVAANVDRVLLVHGINRSLNRRRLERELVIAWESGAQPAVVLAKADLCADPAAAVAEAEAVAIGADVVAVSSVTGAGFDALAALLRAGLTFVVLGASGVGKSTLVNRLLGEDRQRTQSIREADGRGRHTTTASELLVLPGGSILVDTPGLKALALWDGEEGLQRVFADIDELAPSCRFADCQHRAEPGCAVRAEVDEARIESWRKLERELARTSRERSARDRAEERRRWKAIHKAHRAIRPRS